MNKTRIFILLTVVLLSLGLVTAALAAANAQVGALVETVPSESESLPAAAVIPSPVSSGHSAASVTQPPIYQTTSPQPPAPRPVRGDLPPGDEFTYPRPPTGHPLPRPS